MSFSFAANQLGHWTYPSSQTTDSLTFPNPCTPGSIIAVYFTSSSNSAPGTLGDTVNTYTQLHGGILTGGYGFLSAFFTRNTSSSALTVTWSNSGALGFPAFQIAEFPGAATSPLDDTQTTTSGSTLAVNSTLTNELILGFGIPNSGQSMQNGSGWSTTDATGGISPIIYKIGTTATSYTVTFNNSGGIIGASFKPSVAVAAPNLRMLMGVGT